MITIIIVVGFAIAAILVGYFFFISDWMMLTIEARLRRVDCESNINCNMLFLFFL